ncbi:MAG: sulfotransferase, partial [Candidatus Acidiferrum sp.]
MTAVPPPSSSRNHEWTPRFWEGCDFFAWLRLIVRNRFAVQPRFIYIALVITFVSLCHTVLRLVQQGWFFGRPERAKPKFAPLFIIGHWRTGTTLLHELLIEDPRHAFPNTFQCLMPNHFLLSELIFTRLFHWVLPTRRPMDNMAAGWDKPQEDEFALCMLGQPSPYLTIAFPNRPPQDQEAFDLERLPSRDVASWKRSFQ